MGGTLTLRGQIKFDPEDKTNKHKSQGNWKKIAMVNFYGDVSEYYCWFIKKRFNLILGRPIRKFAHITFINDSHRDMGDNVNKWSEVKNKWNGEFIDITFNLNPDTNGHHWWLAPINESKELLQEIRGELGLNTPYYDFHMTIGNAGISYDENEMGMEKIARDNLAHSKYLASLKRNGFI
jgi:hypothetical protein